MNKSTPEELWQRLQQAGIVTGDMPPLVAVEVTPWYVRLLQGFTGQFAAVFLLLFVFSVFKDVIKQEEVALVLGLLLIGAAYGVFRVLATAFTGQFGLMLSFTGHALCLFALHRSLNDASTWLMIAMIEALLVWFIPHFLHRFFSSYAAVSALVIASIKLPILWLMPSLTMLVVTLLWLYEAQWLTQSARFRPVAYAFTFVAIQMHSTFSLGQAAIQQAAQGRELSSQTWLISVNEVLLGGMLVLTILKLLQRYQQPLSSKQSVAALIAGSVLALMSLQATGLAIAWIIILLGFSAGNRVLLGLGMFAFWSYLGRYYYFLNISLLDKSYVLMATGVLMLLMRQALKHGLTAEESHHA